MSQNTSLFDRTRIARRLLQRAPQDDFVTRLMHADLADRLGAISRRFEKALVLAPAPWHVPQQINLPDGPLAFEAITTLGERDPRALLKDRADDYDLIVSLHDLAIYDNAPALLAAMRDHLRPDGLVMAAFCGGLTLTELRQAFLDVDSKRLGGAALRVAPMIDTRQAGGLLQGVGLALPVADVETHVVRYAGPEALLAELRQLGATIPLPAEGKKPLTRRHLSAVFDAYRALASDPDGRVRATLEVIWLSGWKPHESQQKPLKPGSATARLADFLNDRSNEN